MQHWWMWMIFSLVIVSLLAWDLGFWNKKDEEISVKVSLQMSGFYILIAFLFGLWIWYERNIQDFSKYLTAFLIEKSLSLDNVFLIAVIFSNLSIPLKYQHRVLFWGILGVIVTRAIFIVLGISIINHFHWLLYILGMLMILMGFKTLASPMRSFHLKNNLLLEWMKRYFNFTTELDGNRFITSKIDDITGKKKYYATPLLAALLLIEFVDVVFAIDSLPAVFSITQDPYIVYTSNVFAILGLRALYFALAFITQKFYYLRFSLAFILIFIGSKIFIADIMGLEEFPPLISLGVITALLASGSLYSIYKTKE